MYTLTIDIKYRIVIQLYWEDGKITGGGGNKRANTSHIIITDKSKTAIPKKKQYNILQRELPKEVGKSGFVGNGGGNFGIWGEIKQMITIFPYRP